MAGMESMFPMLKDFSAQNYSDFGQARDFKINGKTFNDLSSENEKYVRAAALGSLFSIDQQVKKDQAARQRYLDFNGLNQSAVATPTVLPPIVIPLADKQAQANAAKRSTSQQIARRGRSSTLLNNDALGG